MNTYFIRLIAALLIPCLLADPSTVLGMVNQSTHPLVASGVVGSSLSTTTWNPPGDQHVFYETQAITAPLANFLYDGLGKISKLFTSEGPKPSPHSAPAEEGIEPPAVWKYIFRSEDPDTEYELTYFRHHLSTVLNYRANGLAPSADKADVARESGPQAKGILYVIAELDPNVLQETKGAIQQFNESLQIKPELQGKVRPLAFNEGDPETAGIQKTKPPLHISFASRVMDLEEADSFGRALQVRLAGRSPIRAIARGVAVFPNRNVTPGLTVAQQIHFDPRTDALRQADDIRNTALDVLGVPENARAGGSGGERWLYHMALTYIDLLKKNLYGFIRSELQKLNEATRGLEHAIQIDKLQVVWMNLKTKDVKPIATIPLSGPADIPAAAKNPHSTVVQIVKAEEELPADPAHSQHLLHTWDSERKEAIVPYRLVRGDLLSPSQVQVALRSLEQWTDVRFDPFHKQVMESLRSLSSDVASESASSRNWLRRLRFVSGPSGDIVAYADVFSNALELDLVEVGRQYRRRGIGSELLVAIFVELLGRAEKGPLLISYATEDMVKTLQTLGLTDDELKKYSDKKGANEGPLYRHIFLPQNVAQRLAETQHQNVLKMQPTEIEKVLEEAKAYFDAGNLQQAINHLDLYLKMYPGVLRLLIAKARYYLNPSAKALLPNRDLRVLAVVAAKDAVHWAPEKSSAHEVLSKAYEAQSKPHKGSWEYEWAIQEAELEVILSLGRPQAVRVLRNLVFSRRETVPYFKQLEPMILAQSDPAALPERVRAFAHEVIRYRNQSPDVCNAATTMAWKAARRITGETLAEKQRKEIFLRDADYFAGLIKDKNRNAWSYENQMQISILKKDLESVAKITKMAKKVLKLDPNNVDRHRRVITALVRAGKTIVAGELQRKAKKEWPGLKWDLQHVASPAEPPHSRLPLHSA